MSAYRKHFIVRYSNAVSTVTDVFVCSLNMEHSSGGNVLTSDGFSIILIFKVLEDERP